MSSKCRSCLDCLEIHQHSNLQCSYFLSVHSFRIPIMYLCYLEALQSHPVCLLASSGLFLAFLLYVLCRCKYSQLRGSHIFFMRWLFHRLTFLISRKVFLMLSLSFQAPASGSLPSPFPSYLFNYCTWVRGYISRMVITRSAILLIVWRSGTTFTFSRSSALDLFLQGGR